MVALSNLATQTNLTLIQNGSNRKNSSSARTSRTTSHSIISSNQQQQPNNNYRMQKQSILSLREALLRQSGAEFDDIIINCNGQQQ